MSMPAAAVRLRMDRRQRDGRVARIWPHLHGRARPPDSGESLSATMASVILLIKETARIQRDTAEVLRVLAAQSGNEAAIQALASCQNSLLALLDQREEPLPPAEGQAKAQAAPLTAREETVLHLLQSPLSLREIGQTLYVSHNTVKSHTRAIYRKLGVSNRHDAIQRCQELAILAS